MPNLRSLPGWLPLWLLVAGVSIFLHGPLPLFSTRTLTVAWEMWHLGEWLLPHQNGLPYSHKAPLLYWLIHAGWAVGGVSDVWPRILEVLLSTANLLLLALLARRLFPDRPAVARLAPWALAGTMFWFLYSLQIMFDLLVSACALLSLLGLARRDGRGGFAPQWGLVVLGLWLGLLTKGPVALLHLAFPLLLGPWWNEAARAAPRRWYAAVVGTVVAALALFALWVVPVAILGGEAYRQELLVTQTAGRVVDAFDHGRPVWWYLTVLPILLFPWVAWPAAWRGLHEGAPRADPGLRLLVLWLLPTLLAFSLVSGKQAYYLLPQLAGFALWLAVVVERRAARGDGRNGALWPALALLAIGVLISLQPVADVLAAHAARGGTIANRGRYEGQFNFLARLTAPVVEVDYDSGPPWARANPDALIVDYVDADALGPPVPGTPQPLWRGPFRGEALEVWRAGDWLAARSAPAG